MSLPGLTQLLVRLLCILAGALALSFFVTKGVLVPIGQWYEMNRARNESDLSQAFIVALAAQALCAVIGGWLGNRLFCIWRQKRLDRR
ncbi:hypothetical protein EJP67_13260 [Variovorax guangxiensis]|uniref:Uncharacterized protein n=1 Tax=Variovorax guangxiensis TaxID=1775474 RepID=A0A3S0ZEM5_9BURK|nr:hypothetical protein EJP67_13260 [Variovorax guangxiensis]